MANVVLGVTGSIAAYRAADMARDLMRAGHAVRVCLTRSASLFVGQALFEGLTGEPCLVDAFEEPVTGRMAHIDWARWAEVLLVAPASANTINRLAFGLGEDMLSTIALATTAPWVVAPAMNPTMYASESVTAGLAVLRNRGVEVVEPLEGDVACGENGQGKLASSAAIVERVAALLGRSQLLQGKTVLITSGPTREPIDSVRFLSNRSSGKMGAALAKAALSMGAHVVVVSGPSSTPPSAGAEIIRVETALEMREAALANVARANIVVAAAAVADYRPSSPAQGKLRRSDGPIALELTPNPDIVADLATVAPEVKVVGFAAEPSSDLSVALEKVKRKGLFAIAANDVSRADIGFESDKNELTLVFRDGTTMVSGVLAKYLCAVWLLEQVVLK